jgi:tetratricopeptide (TPR) repeat protein
MLQFVIENGFFGLLFCATLFFIIYKTKTTQENKYINYFLKINLFTIVIFASFSYPTQILPIKIITVVLIGFITILNKKNDFVYTFRKTQRTPRFVLKSIFLLSGVYILFTAFTKTTAIDNGYTEWKIAKDSQKFHEYDLSIDEFKNILPLFSKNGAFLFSYGKCLQKAKQHENAIKIFLKTQNYLNNSSIELSLAKSYKALNLIKKAELSYKQASQMVPVKFYPKYLLVKLYNDTGQANKAIQLAKEITTMKIKINSPTIKKIKKEMENLIQNQ